jgi:RNA polymerase sigma factor (sigma-70 family)
VFQRDPLADPAPLIRRVYSYVAYRLGDGPDAEDVTSDVFELATRYRSSYDPRKGAPVAWLLGIARRRVAWSIANRPSTTANVEDDEQEAPDDVEHETVERLALRAALAALSDNDQELLALRYGADLRARDIARLLDMKTNAVEVALHRALGRLRTVLEEGNQEVHRPRVVDPAEDAV